MIEYQYVRPWLYEKQQHFLFTPKRISVVEASTKTGKTTGCLVWLFERAWDPSVDQDGRNYWWIAPIYGVAKIAYRRAKRFLPPTVATPRDSECKIDLINGASIWFKGSDKPDSLYGEDVYAAVIDEATRCKEESWHAVRSTLTATRGPVRIIGNVKGRRNWAYKLARKAEAERGNPSSPLDYHKLTAWDAADAGILDRAEIEEARDVLPRAVFEELYEAKPSDDGGNPFGLSAIEACVVPSLSAAPMAVSGWDLAKSRDWTVGCGLDVDGGLAYFDRWQGPWENTIARILADNGRTPALVDSTGVGDPILEALQKQAPGVFEGFKFTAPSKQQLMEGLAVAIQRHEVSYPDGILRDELDNFEFKYTRTGVRYSAPEGFHDDSVCALALAVAHRRYARAPGDIGLTV